MMKRVIAVLVVLTFAACAPGEAAETTTTSTTEPVPSTTLPPTTTTSTLGRAIGGQLVKLDLRTLEPVPGLDPIPLHVDSWSLASGDGKWVVVFDWGNLTPIETATWTASGTFEKPAHSARAIHGDLLYTYTETTGQVSSIDLSSGELSSLGEWRPHLWMWNDLQVIPNGLIAGLGGVSSDDEVGTHHWVHWLDPVSGESGEIEVGAIERINEETGVFDGEYEVWETDNPGVVWGNSQLLIVHAEGPEVTVVDLENGDIETHVLDATSWIDRLLAFWTPVAAAKGPSMGTYSSAALSPDGRYLFVSGNRYDVVTAENGSLVEENEHLGLTVVDTETWQIVALPALPIQFVRNAGDTILGVDTTSTHPWLDDIYVLSIDGSGTVSYQGPVTVEGGSCQQAIHGPNLVCSEYVNDTIQRLRVVDPATLETVDGPEIGYEDQLHDNGVLVDSSPLNG